MNINEKRNKVKKKKKSDGVAAPADGTESLDSAMTSAVAEEGQEGAAGQAVEGALPHEDSIESLDDEGEEDEDDKTGDRSRTGARLENAVVSQTQVEKRPTGLGSVVGAAVFLCWAHSLFRIQFFCFLL